MIFNPGFDELGNPYYYCFSESQDERGRAYIYYLHKVEGGWTLEESDPELGCTDRLFNTDGEAIQYIIGLEDETSIV